MKFDSFPITNHKQWALDKRKKAIINEKYASKPRISRDYIQIKNKIKLKHAINCKTDENESYLDIGPCSNRYYKYNNKNVTIKNIKEIMKITKPHYVIHRNNWYQDIELYYKHSLDFIYHHQNANYYHKCVNNKLSFKNEYEISPHKVWSYYGKLWNDSNGVIIDIGRHTLLASLIIIINEGEMNINLKEPFIIYVSNKRLKNKRESNKFEELRDGGYIWHKREYRSNRKIKIEKQMDMNWIYIGSFGRKIKDKIYNETQNDDQLQLIYGIGDNCNGITCRYIKIVNWSINEDNWMQHIKFYEKYQQNKTVILGGKRANIHSSHEYDVNLTFTINHEYQGYRGYCNRYSNEGNISNRAKNKRNALMDIKQGIVDMHFENVEENYKYQSNDYGNTQFHLLLDNLTLITRDNNMKCYSKNESVSTKQERNIAIDSSINSVKSLAKKIIYRKFNVCITIKLCCNKLDALYIQSSTYRNNKDVSYRTFIECQLDIFKANTSELISSHCLIPALFNREGYEALNNKVIIPIHYDLATDIFNKRNPLQAIGIFALSATYPELNNININQQSKWNMDFSKFAGDEYRERYFGIDAQILIECLMQFYPSKDITEMIVFDYLGYTQINTIKMNKNIELNEKYFDQYIVRYNKMEKFIKENNGRLPLELYDTNLCKIRNINGYNCNLIEIGYNNKKIKKVKTGNLKTNKWRGYRLGRAGRMRQITGHSNKKTEKKKKGKPTGRAKKRLLYRKRFISH